MEQGYLHAGPTGAGYFVKMIRGGIEYAMEALAMMRRTDARGCTR